MDLIYANELKEDVDVLDGYVFDLAYGKDENDFVCTVGMNNHVCREGYLLYIEGTEYGGIVDTISPDTEKEELVYSGRTWHGVLEKKVICPDDGYDYLEVSGDGNAVLRQLIERLDLGNLFFVSNEVSEIDIASYQFRYEYGYTGICKMLAEFDGKLHMSFKKGYVQLSAVPLVDYSQDEEFDTSQVSFKITKNYRPVNHLICLGAGDLKDRYVIHLFTDENGGVRPYTITETPVNDEDYIRDNRNQVMFGEDEVTKIYDYPNAADTENYVRLGSEPENWAHVYTQYYQRFVENDSVKYKQLEKEEIKIYTLQTAAPKDWMWNYELYFERKEAEEPGEDDSYTSVKSVSIATYTLQATQPSDWMKNYDDYYEKGDDGKYKKVSPDTNKTYTLLKKKPGDWGKKYSEYFIHFTDGTKYEYQSVSGVSKAKYKVQTMKPSDWTKNFGSYYKRKSKGSGYENVKGTGKDKKTAPTWKAKKYYTKITYSVAPGWKSGTYYACTETPIAPAWKQNKYYVKNTEEAAPLWKTGTYYTEGTQEVPPKWIPWIYLKKVTDHYAELVKGGLERLQESREADKIEIEFDPTAKYDIGDIVGASEPITGVEIWQPVTKKIVTINDEGETIKYEIGW